MSTLLSSQFLFLQQPHHTSNKQTSSSHSAQRISLPDPRYRGRDVNCFHKGSLGMSCVSDFLAPPPSSGTACSPAVWDGVWAPLRIQICRDPVSVRLNAPHSSGSKHRCGVWEQWLTPLSSSALTFLWTFLTKMLITVCVEQLGCCRASVCVCLLPDWCHCQTHALMAPDIQIFPRLQGAVWASWQFAAHGAEPLCIADSSLLLACYNNSRWNQENSHPSLRSSVERRHTSHLHLFFLAQPQMWFPNQKNSLQRYVHEPVSI